jgi:hypothetical protein
MPKYPLIRYSEEDRAYFVEPRFLQARSRIAPTACNEGALCWVRFGPPCLSRRGGCLGCHERPSILNDVSLPPYRPRPYRYKVKANA